jgi:hypothetical protein
MLETIEGKFRTIYAVWKYYMTATRSSLAIYFWARGIECWLYNEEAQRPTMSIWIGPIKGILVVKDACAGKAGRRRTQFSRTPSSSRPQPRTRHRRPSASADLSLSLSAMASTRDLAIAFISGSAGAIAAAAALRYLSSCRTSSPRPQNQPFAANGSAAEAERPPAQSPFNPAKREGSVLSPAPVIRSWNAELRWLSLILSFIEFMAFACLQVHLLGRLLHGDCVPFGWTVQGS